MVIKIVCHGEQTFAHGLSYKQHLVLLGVDSSFYNGLVGLKLMHILQLAFQQPCSRIPPLENDEQIAKCHVPRMAQTDMSEFVR